jgi:hypothetical protein
MSAQKPGSGGPRIGAGRKPNAQENRLKRRSVYMTDAEWDFCSWMWSYEITASEYVRGLVRQDLKRRREQWAQDQEAV